MPMNPMQQALLHFHAELKQQDKAYLTELGAIERELEAVEQQLESLEAAHAQPQLELEIRQPKQSPIMNELANEKQESEWLEATLEDDLLPSSTVSSLHFLYKPGQRGTNQQHHSKKA